VTEAGLTEEAVISLNPSCAVPLSNARPTKCATPSPVADRYEGAVLRMKFIVAEIEAATGYGVVDVVRKEVRRV
jgi:hypothetical protein